MGIISTIQPSEKVSGGYFNGVTCAAGSIFELQFEGIATSDESWVCYFIESDSMFARRREKVIPGPRPGISIKKIMITVFSQRGSQLPCMSSLKSRNTTKNILFRRYFRLCSKRKNVSHARKPQLIFLCTWTTQYATMRINLLMNYVA
jgi:hypothetical protein